ncbi:MAG TPA: hypothetical protein PLU16_15045 [Gallionellaceae bacterium]|nr:hypothetical protein [Gallionellaceae bacterium]HQS76522.1 hypothetical protein [Gallionellaceae bacterium]
MKHTEVMRSVIQASKNPLTVRELFTRTMRIMNEHGDPDDIARACGFEPDDLVFRGKNFIPTIRVALAKTSWIDEFGGN